MLSKKLLVGKYINIASLTTLSAVIFCWLSVVLLIREQIYWSFSFLLVAFLIDNLDGYIARKFKLVSNYGRILDSHVDIMIYLVCPALIYFLYFGVNDPFSILTQMIFLSTGIFRLARFSDIGYVNNKHKIGYPGLPVVFSLLIIFIFLLLNINSIMLLNFFILLHSFLMVQSFVFPKPKSVSVVLFLILILLWSFYKAIYE